MSQKNYAPPYSITPQILKSVEQIGECLGRLDVVAPALVAPHLIIRDQQKDYYAALRSSDNIGHSIVFVEFMLQAILVPYSRTSVRKNKKSRKVV